MYDRMVREHGYSIRKLADKLGKDKGYLENRLRLADAPIEVRELVSLRKDTLSHAYELMKVEDPKKRRRLAEQVARGELTLVKLKEKIEGRRARVARDVVVDLEDDEPTDDTAAPVTAVEEDPPPPAPIEDRRPPAAMSDDALVNAKQQVADAVEELVDVLRGADRGALDSIDRANLAKYLTITKLKLENAIAMVRSDDPSL
jgi:hypothetical protein